VSGGGKGGDVTIGYRYNLGMHMALAHGPFDNVNEIKVDGRVAWVGLNEGTTITVNAPTLFGGDKREGGVSGDVDMEFGGSAQLPNDYLSSVLPGANPAYRGVACAVLKQAYMGNNPYLKPWSFRASRIHVDEDGASQWYDVKSAIRKAIGGPCEYDCNAMRDGIIALGGFPFDDPQRGETIPSVAYTEQDEFTLTLNGTGGNGVGDAWDWTNTWEPVADFCAGGAPRWKFNGGSDLSNARWLTIGGLDSILDLQTTYTSLVRESSSVSLIELGYTGIGCDSYGSLLTVAFYPTLKVSVTDTTATFRSSFWGGEPTVVVDLDDLDGNIHTITVKLNINGFTNPKEANFITNQWSWDADITWSIWVDSKFVSLVHPARQIISADIDYQSEPVLGSVILARIYRGGNGPATNLLSGFVIGADHDDVHQLVLRNSLDYVPGDDCLTGCDDMNPAHIIRECLTQSWGLGYTDADIDNGSFTLSANALHAEGMGMSILWDKEIQIEDFVSEILRHIDAVVYVSRSTGKFVLKLIRDDYDADGMITLDASNARMASDAIRPAIGEMTTSVTVGFTDFDQEEEDGSVTVHNEALIQLQGAVNNAKADYPGFMSRSIASRVALRDLKSLSTPLMSCSVEASRAAAELNIGDVFNLNFPEQGISDIVMRIQSMSVGDGRDNTVSISCIEDAFSVPNFAAIGDIGPGWVDPTKVLPLASSPRLMIESQYYELVLRLGDREVGLILADDPDAGFLFANGGRQGGELNGDLMVDSGAGYSDVGVLDFAPYAYLSADAWYSDDKLYYTDGKDLNQVETGSLAQIGGEIVRVDGFGSDVSGDYVSVGRGVLDTVPAEHIFDSEELTPIVFYAPQTDNVQYTASDSVGIKIMTAIGNQRLSIAPVDTLVFNSRAIRPYPPGNLIIDAASYPLAAIWDGTHTLAWAHRDRLQQTSGAIFDYSDGNIGPEAGTTYTVTVDAILDTGVISADFIDIDAGAATTLDIDSAVDVAPPAEAEFIRFKVTAKRGSYDSWQAAMVVIPV
jgi:hypothetical protein